MATMSDDPHAYHLPVMTGGVGFDGVRRFYGEHFIGRWPLDTEITPVSRTVRGDRVVDEMVVSFTHDVEMDAVRPGGPPARPARTGSRCRGARLCRWANAAATSSACVEALRSEPRSR
jgi:hypothetical protein